MIFCCDICCNSVIIILRLRWPNRLVFITMDPFSEEEEKYRQTIKLINGIAKRNQIRSAIQNIMKIWTKKLFIFCFLLFACYIISMRNWWNERVNWLSNVWRVWKWKRRLVSRSNFFYTVYNCCCFFSFFFARLLALAYAFSCFNLIKIGVRSQLIAFTLNDEQTKICLWICYVLLLLFLWRLIAR